ncbi:hypothetical protein [Allofranklinella schreckenbergeri]|nr:hypothetical protein [Allofranklinella schreckenbergeri]
MLTEQFCRPFDQLPLKKPRRSIALGLFLFGASALCKCTTLQIKRNFY